MMASQKKPQKRYSLFILAIVLLLLGGASLFVGAHDFMIRSIGTVSIMASAYLVRISNVHNRSGSPEPSGAGNNRKVAKAQGRLLWIASLSLVPVLAGAWYLFSLDAANGGQVAWPADVLGGVVLVCAVVWGLLVAKTLGGRGRANNSN